MQVLSSQTTSFYDFTLPAITGEPVPLHTYRGQKVLLVNVASRCGYTRQYAELEKLHRLCQDQVTILGFPANDFGGQEPGTNEEIALFCRKNYGVSFQVFGKIAVTGRDRHPLYAWLGREGRRHFGQEAPEWNFTKYLVGEDGELLRIFAPEQSPLSREVLTAIMA